MSALDQFTQALSVGCRLLWADSNRLERTIGIFGHQRLIAESYSLGGAQHMGFTDLVVHPHLIGNSLEAVGIVGDQHIGSYTLMYWLLGLSVLKRDS